MKCPACQHVCSDLRDLCPSCLKDLRDTKISLGMKVTYPTLSYDELIAKSGKRVATGVAPAPVRNLAPSSPPPVSRVAGVSEVSSLFREALHDPLLMTVGEVELSHLDLGNTYVRDEIDLLFDLTHQSLVDSGFESKFTDHISTSESAEVRAKELRSQLARVEQTLEAPLLSLRTLSRLKPLRDPDDPQAETPSAPSRYRPAQVSERLAALSTDVGIALVLATAVAFSLSQSRTMERGDLFLFFNTAVFLDLIPVVAVFVETLLVLSVLYPLLAYGAFRATPGMLCFGLRIVKDNGSRAALANIAVRAFSVPLAIVSLSWIAVFGGRRALHDVLSHTLVVTRM